ncbi:hypothetical protein LguiA_026464 [Lonicera macranthoides]
MVLTRSKRRLLDVQPASPTLEITNGTISADNFSPTKRAKIRATFARMKAKTNAFHKLINTMGFGWCSETNTVAAEENVWATYLKLSEESWNFRRYARAGFGSEWPLVIRGDTGQDDLCRPWESMARWHVIKLKVSAKKKRHARGLIRRASVLARIRITSLLKKVGTLDDMPVRVSVRSGR